MVIHLICLGDEVMEMEIQPKGFVTGNRNLLDSHRASLLMMARTKSKGWSVSVCIMLPPKALPRRRVPDTSVRLQELDVP